MSRIGKKPIPLPQGVKFEVKGNNVVVQGPKGQVQTHLPAGVQLKQVDGHIEGRGRMTSMPLCTGWRAPW
jgi:large subunit ribosomal protein L6